MSTRVVITKFIRAATLFLAVLIALPLVGIDITTLSIFSGALGVGLGIGLQKIASNYVSGFIVLLDRSLRIGDLIAVGTRRGEVKEIAARYTVVKASDGSEWIIPNETLITETVSHFSFTDPRVAVVLPVTIAYESDVDRACALLLEAARAQPRVLREPARGSAGEAAARRGHRPGIDGLDRRSAGGRFGPEERHLQGRPQGLPGRRNRDPLPAPGPASFAYSCNKRKLLEFRWLAPTLINGNPTHSAEGKMLDYPPELQAEITKGRTLPCSPVS